MFSSWFRFALFSASSRADSYSSCAASSWVLPASSWVLPLETRNSPSCSWASVPLSSSWTAISAMAGSTASSPRLASIFCSLSRCSFSWVSISCALVSWSRRAAAVSFNVCCSGCIPSFSAVSASCRAVSSVVAFCRATFAVESVDRLPLSSLTRARRAALPSMTAWACACSARLASICACKSARSLSSSVLLRESCSDAISTSSA